MLWQRKKACAKLPQETRVAGRYDIARTSHDRQIITTRVQTRARLTIAQDKGNG